MITIILDFDTLPWNISDKDVNDIVINLDEIDLEAAMGLEEFIKCIALVCSNPDL